MRGGRRRQVAHLESDSRTGGDHPRVGSRTRDGRRRVGSRRTSGRRRGWFRSGLRSPFDRPTVDRSSVDRRWDDRRTTVGRLRGRGHPRPSGHRKGAGRRRIGRRTTDGQHPDARCRTAGTRARRRPDARRTTGDSRGRRLSSDARRRSRRCDRTTRREAHHRRPANLVPSWGVRRRVDRGPLHPIDPGRRVCLRHDSRCSSVCSPRRDRPPHRLIPCSGRRTAAEWAAPNLAERGRHCGE